jgi:transcriptional regulator with XRE-family HTH domain
VLDATGLPRGAGRRVPGLRREEVALLAGISGDYYIRLERGRDTTPSRQVLDSLARVLCLNEIETEYLLALGMPSRGSRRQRPAVQVPDRLHHLLAALEIPAFVESRHFDVLASNDLAVALSPRLVPGRNRLLSLLLDDEERAFHEDWEQAVVQAVGSFRHEVSEDPIAPRAVELVGELSISSARFRSLWARHDVRRLTGGSTSVVHPSLGKLRLHREKLPVDSFLLVLYYPDQGGENADKLRLLASLHA